ncbi:DUF6281 family protein [Streptomyces althioticus]|uniref:DUF6281 family protein n=1 Tax=Streptomyces althioticus TaxID=83380 RepID=UPI0033CC969D
MTHRRPGPSTSREASANSNTSSDWGTSAQDTRTSRCTRTHSPARRSPGPSGKGGVLALRSSDGGDEQADSCAYLVHYQDRVHRDVANVEFTADEKLGSATLPPCDDIGDQKDAEQAGETTTAYRLQDGITLQDWRVASQDVGAGLTLPHVGPHAVRGLKFAEALPARLAEATFAARLGDAEGAHAVLSEPVRFLEVGG